LYSWARACVEPSRCYSAALRLEQWGSLTREARMTSQDIWHVKLANGETRKLTLDELDVAFRDGLIDERTPVLAAGALRWSTLGEVAGLDEPSPEAAPMPNSIAPIAIDSFGVDARAGNAPFGIDIPIDVASDADVDAFRPRRGRAIFRVLTTMVVVAGLGFAAFRAKPAVQRALASRAAARLTAFASPAAPPLPPQPPQEPPSAPPPAPTTVSATSLPDAPLPTATTAEEKTAAAEAEKKAAAEAKKAKRSAQKRAK
jgi:hypothetical protein